MPLICTPPPKADEDIHLLLGDPWVPGRFAGIQKMRTGPNLVPRLFAKDQVSYFGHSVGLAMGGDATASVDKDFVFYHFIPEKPANEIAATRKWPDPTLKIEELDADGNPTGGYAQLLAAEYLQFADIECSNDKEHEARQHFLILHVCAEFCSNEFAESISNNLYRPRFDVPNARWSHNSGAPTTHKDKDTPAVIEYIDHLLLYLRDQLNLGASAGGGQGSFDFILERGLYLVSPGGALPKGIESAPSSDIKRWKWHLEDYRRRAASMPDGHVATKKICHWYDLYPTVTRSSKRSDLQSKLIPAAQRVVSAIPMHNLTELPTFLQKFGEHSLSPVYGWAWTLAEGANLFTEEVPAFTEEEIAAATCAKFQSWTIWASQNGLAAVRQTPQDHGEKVFWYLAATRYVDIVLLQMRARYVLQSMSKQITNEQRSTKELNHNIFDKHSSTNLEQDLKDLALLRLRLVEFRQKLWFQQIPKRSTETAILRTIQRVHGDDVFYDDVTDEINLRNDVFQAQLSQKELFDSREREQTNSNLALIGVITASAFATPAFIEAFTDIGNLRAGISTVVITAVVAATSLGLWNVSTRSKSSDYDG